MRSKKLLTAAAIFCRSLAWFPLCILLPALRAEGGQSRLLTGLMDEALMTIHSDTQILLPACLLCCLSFAVQMAARAAGERFRILPRKVLIFKLSAAIPAAAVSIFAVCRISGSLFNAVVLTAAAILLPLHGIDNPPEKLFAQPHYVAFLTAVILSALALHLAEQPTFTGWLFAVTAVISALFLLLLNQFMLLRLVNRRSNAETPVPREIRRSNFVMVIGMLLLTAAILVFRRPLTAALVWMRDTAATAFWKLMVMIIRKQGGAAEIEEDADILPPPAEGEASPLWVLVWIPIIFVMWIVWRNLLSDWVYEIHELLRRLLAFLRGETRRNGGRKRPAESEEYYDTETTARRPLTKKQMKRRWRQQLRAWRSQPDSREKFYAGYQLLLTAPAWETNELRDADTVQEIREKWLSHHTPQDALDAVTSAYHTDRYAERGLPEQAIAELSAALDKLRR